MALLLYCSQVWFSSCWSLQAFNAFREAILAVMAFQLGQRERYSSEQIERNQEVRAFLSLWGARAFLRSEPPPTKEVAAVWLRAAMTDEELSFTWRELGEAADNMTREEDRRAAARRPPRTYVL